MIFCKFIHFINASSDISVNFAGIFNVVNVDDVNACDSIFSTPLPIVTLARDVVIKNAPFLISFTESGITIPVNFELYAKQQDSIVVTVFGIVYVPISFFCGHSIIFVLSLLNIIPSIDV